MKVILGTGQLGRAILQVLQEKQPQSDILLVNRSGKVDFTLPKRVQIKAADVTNMTDIQSVTQDATVIYSSTDVPYPAWGTFYPATTDVLIKSIEKNPAKLVFADNLYSYGNVKGAIMHETLPHNATTKKGKIRAEVVNKLVRSLGPKGANVAIVKAADFIGPHIHKGVFGVDFLQQLLTDKPINLFGKPQLLHTFTYIYDFANAMVRVSDAPDAYGQIWHVPNAPALSLYEWLQLFEKQANKQAKIKIATKNLLRLVGLFNPFVREYVELSYQFEYPYLVNHEKYAARFGDSFTSPEQIVAQTLYWYTTILKK